MKHDRIIFLISGVGLVLLVLMLFFTSPTEIGPFGVLLFFTTVYVVSYGLVSWLMRLFMRLAFKRQEFRHKDYLYAAVLAFAPIMFLMARSFGAINWWTAGLICFFIALTEFLVSKKAS